MFRNLHDLAEAAILRVDVGEITSGSAGPTMIRTAPLGEYGAKSVFLMTGAPPTSQRWKVLGAVMTRVGITGHQRLDDPEAWGWVASVMRDELARLAPPLIAVTSLAVGANQLLARLVLERGGMIHAVPLEAKCLKARLPCTNQYTQEAQPCSGKRSWPWQR